MARGKTKGVVVRALLRNVENCAVVDVATGEDWPMTSIANDGMFEVFIAKRPEVFGYQLRMKTPAGEMRQFYDPDSFLPTLGPEDL